MRIIEVETRHHITQSDYGTLPAWACTGKCLKVWWEEDLSHDGITALDLNISCKRCGGQMTQAIEGQHYTVIAVAEVNQDPNSLRVGHLSHVKDEFILASQTW